MNKKRSKNKKPNATQQKLLSYSLSAFGLVSQLIMDLHFIHLIRKQNQNLNQLKSLLSGTSDYYHSRFSLIYEPDLLETLEKNSLHEDSIIELIEKLKQNIHLDISPLPCEVINSMERFVRKDFDISLSSEAAHFDDYISLLGKEIDFLLGHAQDMNDTINLIESSGLPNKEKMLEVTYYSYSRTITSYVEDCSKEFIRSLFKISHLFIIRLIAKTFLTQPGSLIEKLKGEIIDSSRKGMGDVDDLIRKFLPPLNSIKKQKNEEITLNLKTFKKFVECRNSVIHEYRADNDNFNFIMLNWDKCLNLLSNALNEFTLGDSHKDFLETLLTELEQFLHDEQYILNHLYPAAKGHLP
ncbi:hypothetical protein [Pantoea endophytica]